MRVQGFLFQVLKRSLRTAGDTHLPLRMSHMHEYYIRPNFPLHSVCCYAELTRIFISNLSPFADTASISLSHMNTVCHRYSSDGVEYTFSYIDIERLTYSGPKKTLQVKNVRKYIIKI